MLQDPNVERYIEIAVKPLKKEIEQMKAQIEELNPHLRQTDVGGSPSFEEWLDKYFETPKMKMMYKRKDGKGEYDREKLIRDYKRAYRLS
jgi:hypothetical protein